MGWNVEVDLAGGLALRAPALLVRVGVRVRVKVLVRIGVRVGVGVRGNG